MSQKAKLYVLFVLIGILVALSIYVFFIRPRAAGAAGRGPVIPPIAEPSRPA